MNSTTGAWTSFLFQLAMVPLSTIWLFEGVRLAVSRRSNKSSVIFAVFGAAFLLGNGVAALWAASSLTSTLDTLDSTFGSAQVQEMSDEVLARLPVAERAEKSRLLAQINFTNTGRITAHRAPDGASVKFAPTETEIKDREKIREGLAEARARMDQVRTKAFALLIAAITAVASGAFIARRSTLPNGG